MIEVAIAIPVFVATIMFLAVIQYVVVLLSPETSLTPRVVTNMAESPSRMLVYCVLLLSFTFAPVAEEVFFRGFLYNAFRARMPAIVALLSQSVIFGICHFYGSLHTCLVIVLGLILTALYEWRKTLLAPILVHAGLNLLAAIGTLTMMMTYANSPLLGVGGEPGDTKCVVRTVFPGSAAEVADLRVEDIITSFNGDPIRDFPHLSETVPLYRPGDEIVVTFERAGSLREVTVVLQSRGDP